MKFLFVISIFLVNFLISSCSSVSRHTYYYPSYIEINGIRQELNNNKPSPYKSNCVNDIFVNSSNSQNDFSEHYYTNKDKSTLLFGISYLPIIPIFPLSFLNDAIFGKEKLAINDIKSYGNKESEEQILKSYIEKNNGDKIYPFIIEGQKIKFPIAIGKLNEFIFVIPSYKDQPEIKVKFIQTHRTRFMNTKFTCLKQIYNDYGFLVLIMSPIISIKN